MAEMRSSAGAEGLRSGRAAEDPASSWIDDEIELRRYTRLFRQHWMVLLAATIVGAAAGLAVATGRPILYQAASTVLIGRVNVPVNVATSRALLENQTLVGEALKETGSSEPPLSFIQSSLDIEQVPATNLMKVKVSLPDADRAARLSNLISTKAVELNRRIVGDEVSAVRDQLKELLDQATARFNTAQQQYLTYRENAQIELLETDASAMIGQRPELLNLRVRVQAEKAKLAAAEREIQRQPPLLAAPRAVTSESGMRRMMRAEDAARVARESAGTGGTEEGTRLLPRRPSATRPGRAQDPVERDENASDLPADRQRPQTTQSGLTAGTGGSRAVEPGRPFRTSDDIVDFEALDLSDPYVNPVYQTLAFQIATSRTRLAGLEREERELSAHNIGDARLGKLSELYKRQSALARLEAEFDVADRVLRDLTLRYEQSRTDSVVGMVQWQIVDRALPPDRPLPRGRGRSLALGAVAGLAIAALVVLMRSGRPAVKG